MPKIEDEIKRLEQEAQGLTQRAKQLGEAYNNIGMQIRQTREELLIVEGQFRAFKSMLPQKPKGQKKKTIRGKGEKNNGT